MQKILSRRIYILSILIFVFAFAFALILLQNLPINFGDDINNIRFSAKAPWSSVIKNLCNPLTAAWYVHSQENLLTTKVFETFLLKLVFTMVSLNATLYYILKALAFAIVSLLICLIVYRITGSLLAAGGASLFFIMTPPTYMSVSLLTDFEIISQTFVCLSLFIFFVLYFRQHRSALSFTLLIVAMILSLLAGTKTRETARILPFLLTGFVMLDQRTHLLQWIRKSWRNIVLILVIIISFLFILPLRKPTANFDQESHSALKEYHIDNVYKVVFCNPAGSDPEKRSAFFSRDAKIPTSLARTFGFYLDWAFIISLTAICLAFVFKRKLYGTREWSRAYSFLFLWTALTCLCFGFGFTNVFLKQRYLLTVIVPATALVFSTFYFAGQVFPRFIRYAFVGALIVYTLLCVQTNFDHIIFLRNYFGGADVAEHNAVKAVYRALYEKGVGSQDELFDFFQCEYGRNRIKNWDNPATPDYVKSFSKDKPFVFIESYDKLEYPANLDITLIAECTTVNRSLYFQILGKVKKKIGRTLYLYGKLPAK